MDSKHLYQSNKVVHLAFQIHDQTFFHDVYVLPQQLFSMTLGCDRFINARATLDFEHHILTLLGLSPLTFCKVATDNDHLCAQIAYPIVSPQKRTQNVSQVSYITFF